MPSTPPHPSPSILIGRHHDLTTLIHLLRRGRHTLVVGPKGVGKSRLMWEARSVLTGETKRIELSPASPLHTPGFHTEETDTRIVWIQRVCPLGDCIKELIGKISACGDLRINGALLKDADTALLKKALTGLGSAKLQEMILESLRTAGSPYLIFFDTLDRITPLHLPLLEGILSASVVCAAVAEVKEGIHFRRLWGAFSRVDLDPLDAEHAWQLVNHAIERYGVRALDRELYVREVMKSAGGNPSVIQSIVWQGSREAQVGREEVGRLRRYEQGEYFNLGPLYIFLAGALTLYKILSAGAESKETYIFYSALASVVFFVFRVFRSFFLFRPRREG